MHYIRTKGGVTLFIKQRTREVSSTDPVYKEVVAALSRGADEDQVAEILDAELRKLEEATHVTDNISIKAGVPYFMGEPLDGVLAERMLTMVKEGYSLTHLDKFMVNLSFNPSNTVVRRLYEFLDVGNCPITPDGHFLAYKAVRQNFFDIHSGTFNNSVGQRPEMPRNKVDDRDSKVCSHGLHVCSFDYLPHFSHANGHVMICKVDPKDVVSIPVDYKNTKMRVCTYEVIGEHEGYYLNHGDILSHTTVATDDDSPFSVHTTSNEDDTSWDYFGSYARLVDAAQAFEEALQDTDVAAARIMNNASGVVVDERENPSFIGQDDPFEDLNTSHTFTLMGVRADNGVREVLSEGEEFDSIPNATLAALDLQNETYSSIQVLNRDGVVETTIS